MGHGVWIWTDGICQRTALLSRNKQILGKYRARNRLAYAHDDIPVYFLQAITVLSLSAWKSCHGCKQK